MIEQSCKKGQLPGIREVDVVGGGGEKSLWWYGGRIAPDAFLFYSLWLSSRDGEVRNSDHSPADSWQTVSAPTLSSEVTDYNSSWSQIRIIANDLLQPLLLLG